MSLNAFIAVFVLFVAGTAFAQDCSDAVISCTDDFTRNIHEVVGDNAKLCKRIDDFTQCVMQMDCPYISMNEREAMVEQTSQQLMRSGVNCTAATARAGGDGTEAPISAQCTQKYGDCAQAFGNKIMELVRSQDGQERLCGELNGFISCVFSTGCPISEEMRQQLVLQAKQSFGQLNLEDCELVFPSVNSTKAVDVTSPGGSDAMNSTTNFPVDEYSSGSSPDQYMPAALLNPFLKWVSSSTRLNEVQAKLAEEQTKVAKLMRTKLNLEIRKMKKPAGKGRSRQKGGRS